MRNQSELGQFNPGGDGPLNLNSLHDELGRVPIIGPASDRELFFDLPSAGLPAQIAECQPPVEREFLANDFSL